MAWHYDESIPSFIELKVFSGTDVGKVTIASTEESQVGVHQMVIKYTNPYNETAATEYEFFNVTILDRSLLLTNTAPYFSKGLDPWYTF